ncbi:calmodulin-like protein 30 [Malania oleifera]|uniref:calmodulin-like protein 30 n=1 Tax=Malania oleifera TaxID=397392 RepID=UPI0025AE2EF0|nr:calmodulin-like protein 30 [Malania oleifera]
MRHMSFLDFQYNISRRSFSRKPSRLFSLRDRQNSGLTPPVVQPNLEELRKVFDKFDANRDGKISRKEYQDILKALGKPSTAREVGKIFEVADLNGDGFVDFKEFVEVHRKGGGVQVVDIQTAFQTFDLNNDGRISAEEVLEVLRKLGESCSLEDCRRMVRAVDTDGNGMIEMDEFTNMMTRPVELH